MDKIETGSLQHIFSHAEHTVLHASERYSESRFTFREHNLVSGESQVLTTPGMTLTRFSITPKRTLMLIDTEDKEAVESAFVIKGDVESRFNNISRPLSFSDHQHNIQYNSSFAGTHTISPGGFSALSVTYDLPYLKAMLQSAEISLLDKIGNSMERKESFLAATGSLRTHSSIAEAIHTIIHCSFSGPARYIYMEGKMMELFALQVDNLCATQNVTVKETWSGVDKEKLFALRDYIETAYLEPLSLRELTYKFGLNEFKLKKGYKHFFHTTVFGHIHQLKMKHAKAMLANKQATVSEAAWTVGYNNVSSFSCEFKKCFGYSPITLRQESKGL